MKLRLMLILLSCSLITLASGPKLQESYIERYRDIAIHEMKEFGIPASITLAQGLLESGSGTSYLAVNGNNHFGIKCHLDWYGGKLYRDDDRKNECFRAYDNPDQSFRDHSLFLSNRSRYAFLFEEKPTDYKAWARGLRKAGYATNRKYADLLIDLIERYDLHQYDDPSYVVPKKKIVVEPLITKAVEYKIQLSENRVQYVRVIEGEDIDELAYKLDRWPGELLKFNEFDDNVKLKEGQIVYLQPKRNKATKDYPVYIVREGDTLHSIAQHFAIKAEKLRLRNGLSENQPLEIGQKLKLR